MVKNTFIYIVIIIFVGVTVWFFIQKANNASNQKDLDTVINKEESESDNMEKEPEIKQEWVKLDNGLEYLDVVIGDGKEAQPGDVVATHYNGTLVDGTKFDNSYDRGQPFAFILGGGMVIKGWDIGVAGMKVGGKRKLVIPPDLGYGNRANGPIPANSTLLFDVELVDAQTPE